MSEAAARAVVYVRVSTIEQGEGLSLDSQRQACLAEIAARGWSPAAIFTDTTSGKSMKGRRGLAQALDGLREHRYDVLLVSRLDRLARSVMDFSLMLDRASKEGWSIVCLDPAVDMTSPFGECMAYVAAAFAQLERRMISQRQLESVRARKEAGTYRAGRPYAIHGAVEQRIVELRELGLSAERIAARLESEGFRPERASRWHPRAIRRVLARHQRR